MLVGNNDNEPGLTAAMTGAYNKPSGSPSPAPAMLGMSDAAFSCPAGYTAKVRVKAGVPAWRYRYHGEFENTRIATVPGPGAYHSGEIPLVFGATELRPGASKDTPEEAKLSKNMRHAWAEFAKDPVNGLKKLGWPVYDESSKLSALRIFYHVLD
jgi:carboxylesterase type B